MLRADPQRTLMPRRAAVSGGPGIDSPIHQGAGGKQPVGVLRQSSVADLHEPELQFHDLKDMFHAGAHFRFDAVLLSFHEIHSILISIAPLGVKCPCSLRSSEGRRMAALLTPTSLKWLRKPIMMPANPMTPQSEGERFLATTELLKQCKQAPSPY